MSILSVDNISPIGSGTSVTVNSAATLVLTNANSTGVITATSFVGSGANLTGVLSNIVEDTSPQLGANLDTNTKCIDFGDSNTGTVNRLRFGASTDFEIFHNGTNNHIDCHTAGQDLYIRPTKDVYIQDYSTDDIFIKMIKDGAVELYYDDSKKLETTSIGVTISGDLKLPDNEEVRLGNGNDLQLYHNGSQSYVSNNTGNLNLTSTGAVVTKVNTSEDAVVCNANGSVDLYHDNSKKFETMSTGARIQGGLLFGSDTAAANNLDDYEEGSWTATLNGHSSPTNVATNNPTTSRTATGHYRKIGSYVHAQVTWSNLQYNGANDMHNHQLQTITGLPFTSMGTLFTSELGYSRGIYGRYNNSIIEEAIFYFSLSANSTTVYPAASQIVQNSPGTLYHTVSNSSSSMYYSFQMSYYVS